MKMKVSGAVNLNKILKMILLKKLNPVLVFSFSKKEVE